MSVMLSDDEVALLKAILTCPFDSLWLQLALWLCSKRSQGYHQVEFVENTALGLASFISQGWVTGIHFALVRLAQSASSSSSIPSLPQTFSSVDLQL